MLNKFVNRKEAADLLRVSNATIRRMEDRGELIGVKGYGKETLYLEEDVNRLLEKLSEKFERRKKAIRELGL